MRLWTIRDEQLAAFRTALERRVEDRAVAYVRRAHPAICATLAEDSIRASVATALQKRETWRFDSEETLFGWLDLMYLLGFDFDVNPEHGWVREVLTDFDLGARTRLAVLVEQARARADREPRG